MRLVTVRSAGGPRAGVVVDVAGVDRVALLADPVTAVLGGGAARERAEDAAASVTAASPALADLDLAPPVTPGKILCLGYNYRGHVPDGVDPTADDPAFPDVFVKTPNTLAGPDDAVVLPTGAVDADYEGELAIVIGRRAHEVSLADALGHVGGYTILDDVSDRAWQRRQSQWALGKCSDGFAPLGPWITTRDAAPDPQDVLVEVVRDGVVTVSQSTATTIFSVAFVVHHLSQVMTLEPGDVISTGTPQKLPAAQAAHRPLAAGDTVTVRITGLGELTTRFIDPLHRPASSTRGSLGDHHGRERMILDTFRLDGRTALVTGSSRGLGQGAAVALAEAGADVALLDRGDARETAARIEALGRRVHRVQLDFAEASAADYAAAVGEIEDALAPIDILVNNAGTIRRAPAAEHPASDWDDVLAVNLDSVFHLSQAVGRGMIARGHGRIVNVASMLSFQGGILVPGYTASKHAVAGLTKALANEWAASGVTVNAIAPGYMATDNTAPLRADEDRSASILARIPAGRWGTPGDLQGAFVFLASDAAAYVTGAIIPVDGGWLVR